MNLQDSLLKSIAEKRRTLIEVLIGAVTLGVAIEGIATLVVADLVSLSMWIAWPFLLLLLFCSSYVVFTVLKPRLASSYKIDGVLSFSYENGKVIPRSIICYPFCDDVVEAILHVTVENEALKRGFEVLEVDEHHSIKQLGSGARELLTHAIEYVVLKRFANACDIRSRSEKEVEWQLVDINNERIDCLRSNQIIEIFATPMERRAAFYDSENPSAVKTKRFTVVAPDGQTSYALSKSNAKYERFLLEMPPEMKLSREDGGALKVSYGSIDLSIDIQYNGRPFLIDPLHFADVEFSKSRIHCLMAAHSFEIEVHLESHTMWKFSTKEEEKYAWIEEFVRSLKESVSYSEYELQHSPILFQVYRTVAALRSQT